MADEFISKFGDGSLQEKSDGLRQVFVCGVPHVRRLTQGSGILNVRGGSQVRGPSQDFGFHQVRGQSQSRGVPQVRGGTGLLLGSARYTSRPAWVGPPYTQISPHVTIENVPASKSNKRKEEISQGNCLFVDSFVICR